MKSSVLATLGLLLAATPLCAQTQEAALQTNFRVRYVTPEAVYIEGGRNAGLAEGTMLIIKPAATEPDPKDAKAAERKDLAKAASSNDIEPPPPVAQLKVVSIAETSAVCEIVSTTRPLVVGDIVSLPRQEIDNLVVKRSLSNTRQYPMVATFSLGDPMDEEVRDNLPRPPLPEVNMSSGRIGFDYASTFANGFNASQVGFVLRADITRIGGTHWNLTGYWRGELRASSSSTATTTQDLVNRTYQFGLIYNNPRSHYTMGIGRLYLPWASSLGVIDGLYGARKLSHHATTGIFAGVQQDPTAWNYDPNRHVGGGFINFDGGDYGGFKYANTFGYGINTEHWQIQRPFFFSENVINYRRVLTIYHALQADSPTPGPGQTAAGPGIGNSYLSVRLQPTRRISLDFNDTYFRDVPTYQLSLVGTGLLDKYLFEGISGGARVELPLHITAMANIGRSSNSSQKSDSWNEMFGLGFGRIWKTGLHVDLRYARFNSSFATGNYTAIMLSRTLWRQLRINIEAGRQAYTSLNATNTGSNFLNFSLDTNVGRRFFLQSSVNIQRGGLAYTQLITTFGYRFDNRHKLQGGAHEK